MCRRDAGLLPHCAAALLDGTGAVPDNDAEVCPAAHDRGWCEPATYAVLCCAATLPAWNRQFPAAPSLAVGLALLQASPACGWRWAGTTTQPTPTGLSQQCRRTSLSRRRRIESHAACAARISLAVCELLAKQYLMTAAACVYRPGSSEGRTRSSRPTCEAVCAAAQALSGPSFRRIAAFIVARLALRLVHI